MTQAGIVYFMVEGPLPWRPPAETTFYVKIGWTRAPHANARKLTCQTGNPRPLFVVRELEGSCMVENRFHALFNEVRQQGEWFELAWTVLREIIEYDGLSAQRLYEELSLKTAAGVV